MAAHDGPATQSAISTTLIPVSGPDTGYLLIEAKLSLRNARIAALASIDS
jgi:hypothetical protein